MVPSGIDKEKLLIQFDRVEEHLSEINRVKEKLREKEDEIFYSALERLLQLVIEDCLNIGSHIISGLNFKRADSYKEIFLRLEEGKIISNELSQKMQAFVSFRNRLVHMYWEVNRSEVKEELEELNYIKQFVKETSKLL
jgi:uncharacterized protein YutE (UPF0331/DUF86 family)